MKIELSPEQKAQLEEDKYLRIDIGDSAGLYFEFNNDNTFNYAEIFNPKENIGRRQGFSFDSQDLERLMPKKPIDPSYYHNDPLCPNCSTYLIYKFECCPKCGQVIDWRERE